MSVFLLPLEITRELERDITKFWWNPKSDERKGIHWMSYDRLSRHKSTGGMGFHDFRDFNMAMLGKQGWRLVTNPNSLVGRVFKARYYPQGNFLDSGLGNNPIIYSVASGSRKEFFLQALGQSKVSSLRINDQMGWDEDIF
ncbi:putative mitochondrial protein AtMg00310 [Apium graveolens]|uniref:putative mitochondrial protein AtMg00310 n=1 Tax=Apium graveolens TaxID=4045 RepID=UPI003D7B86CA